MTTTLTSLTSEVSVWMKTNAKLGVSPITHLFNRLDGAYPGKWRLNYQSPDAIENWETVWAESFAEEGITPLEVKTGLTNCRRMFDWPPSLTEFIRACRPTLNPETAFHEAIKGFIARRRGDRGIWTHPAIYHAGVDIGQHDIMNGSYAAMRSRWEATLTRQLSKTEWEPIPASPVALPEPKKTELTNEEAKRAMKRLGADSVLVNSGRDPKAWAVKILANPNGKTLFSIAAARAVVNGAPA